MRRAVLVADGCLQVEAALGALAAAGFEAVTVSAMTEVLSHVEVGAVVVVMGLVGGSLGPDQAAAMAAMPPGFRRSCVVVLVGPQLATGDGLKAFLLGADLVVAAAHASRLGELAAAAVAAKRTLVGPLDPTAASRLGG